MSVIFFKTAVGKNTANEPVFNFKTELKFSQKRGYIFLLKRP
jgi:hypothetical protein